MTELQRLVRRISNTQGCSLDQLGAYPHLRDCDRLPDDLAEFYRLCGGARLFEASPYSTRIVGPEEFVRSNPVIVGSEHPDDISDYWYVVVKGGEEEAISIDCGSGRLGRCYDSFWDRHGVAGDCRVVALSFTELVSRLLDACGGYWYWLASDWRGYGDAYDVR